MAEEAVEIDPAVAQVLAQACPYCGGRMIVIETFEAGCQFRRTAYRDIPVVVENMRQYWMPTRFKTRS